MRLTIFWRAKLSSQSFTYHQALALLELCQLKVSDVVGEGGRNVLILQILETFIIIRKVFNGCALNHFEIAQTKYCV